MLKKVELKRRTPLKAKTRISPISDKQRERTKKWNAITDEVAEEHDFICQWCGRLGVRQTDNPWLKLDGHHITLRSRGRIDTKENCYLPHRLPCHRFIDDNNIDVSKYPSEKSWRER